MKILHICNCLRGGGIQNFLLSLLPEQVLQCHCVYLVVIEEYDYDYCEILERKLCQHNVKVVRLNKKQKNKLSLIKTINDCRNLIKDIRPDVVNTHGEMSHFYGALSTIFTSIKFVITVHNAPEHWPFYVRWFCGNKPIIFCSDAAYEMRLQNSPIMASINNGISRNIVSSDNVVDLRKEYNLKETDKIIVSVGSLRPQKNYTFIKSIIDESHDSNLHFFICGGNYGEGFVSVDEFKDYPNIHCLGLRSDVSAIENGADLFLSCATFEGLPIAVLEAYFNGIPCVLSPIQQHINISNVDRVWIPKTFEPKDFYDCIKQALAINENHNAICDKRKLQIEKYSISDTCKKYLSFYEKLIYG